MGAYDCKVNDNEMMNDNTVHIINGPSTDGFPAFEFTGPWEVSIINFIFTMIFFDYSKEILIVFKLIVEIIFIKLIVSSSQRNSLSYELFMASF